MTGDLVLIVLKIKLIVIGQLERKEGQSHSKPDEDAGKMVLGAAGPSLSSHLFSFRDSPAGDDDDLVLLVKCHHLCYTVRGTGVVNVPGWQDRVSVRDTRQHS